MGPPAYSEGGRPNWPGEAQFDELGSSPSMRASPQEDRRGCAVLALGSSRGTSQPVRRPRDPARQSPETEKESAAQIN
jgi:hypothetical protein